MTKLIKSFGVKTSKVHNVVVYSNNKDYKTLSIPEITFNDIIGLVIGFNILNLFMGV